jgi:hypothetical protein
MGGLWYVVLASADFLRASLYGVSRMEWKRINSRYKSWPCRDRLRVTSRYYSFTRAQPKGTDDVSITTRILL